MHRKGKTFFVFVNNSVYSTYCCIYKPKGKAYDFTLHKQYTKLTEQNRTGKALTNVTAATPSMVIIRFRGGKKFSGEDASLL